MNSQELRVEEASRREDLISKAYNCHGWKQAGNGQVTGWSQEGNKLITGWKQEGNRLETGR